MTSVNLHPVHVYGLTETYGPITKGYIMPEWDELPEKKDKFAKMARQGHGFITSLPARVIKQEEGEQGIIIDVEKDGKEIGEIVFDGNICARGYYKDEKATRKLFLGGVCHSGDLAVWHPDGAVQILDVSAHEPIRRMLLTAVTARKGHHHLRYVVLASSQCKH
jgi:acyl-CoA synthetase (AMP-forming)/AMP-acid ligase II